MSGEDGSQFPSSLVIRVPFPSERLAQAAITSMSVEEELSQLVRRSFSVVKSGNGEDGMTILQTTYRATTDRMLRVAVNGFFESLGTVIQIMEELDVDVLNHASLENMDGVQGIEYGSTDDVVAVA